MAAAAALPAGGGTLLADDDTDAEIKALRAQIQLLDQRLHDLETKQRLKEQQDAAAATATAPRVTVSDKGFALASADGASSLRIGGLVQLDSRLYFGDGGGVYNNSFVLRRARLISEGTLGGIYSFQIIPELGGSTVSLLDANFTIAPTSAVQFKIGRFKVPVGLELLQSDPATFFVERSLVTDLVPNRDLGVQVGGTSGDGRVTYAVGVFNGVPDAANTSNADFDNDKDVAGRVFAQPFKNDKDSSWRGLGLGVAGSLGRQKGPTAVTAGYKTEGQQTIFKYNTSVVADGQTWRISPQGYYYLGPFGALGEYAVSTVNVRPSAAGAKTALQHESFQLLPFLLSAVRSHRLAGSIIFETGATPVLRNLQKSHHAVAVLEQLHFLPRRNKFQCVAFRVAEHKSSTGREQLRQIWIVEELLRKRSGTAVHIFFAVRRVGKNQIELPPAFRELIHHRKNVLRPHFEFLFKASGARVVADEFRVAMRFLNANRRGRAAAQAIEAQRAGTGKEFQHPCADDPRAERVEDRLFDEVGCRADVESFRNLQNPPSRIAAGDAHVEKLTMKHTKHTKQNALRISWFESIPPKNRFATPCVSAFRAANPCYTGSHVSHAGFARQRNRPAAVAART